MCQVATPETKFKQFEPHFPSTTPAAVHSLTSFNRNLPIPVLRMAPKTVLITGCSAGGIGHALALAFQKRGYTVFATARSVQKMADLEQLPNVHLLALDVTSTESIAVTAKEVADRTGGKLDVLVNNAGGQYVMPVLDIDMEVGKSIFEVNYWAVVRMVQNFSDMLIAARGTIVNVGSTAGVLHLPFQGKWSSSL
jgi:1-acylglycerone phosphate reductase